MYEAVTSFPWTDCTWTSPSLRSEPSYLAVRTALDHAQHECLPLLLGQDRERLADRAPDLFEIDHLLDPFVVLGRDLSFGHPQTPASASVHRAVPVEATELVAGDPVQPPDRSEPVISEPSARGEGLRERLRRELGRRLRIQRPPREVPEEGLGVALEHHAEDLGLVPRADDQFDVVPVLVHPAPAGSVVHSTMPLPPDP